MKPPKWRASGQHLMCEVGSLFKFINHMTTRTANDCYARQSRHWSTQNPSTMDWEINQLNSQRTKSFDLFWNCPEVEFGFLVAMCWDYKRARESWETKLSIAAHMMAQSTAG
eukprot:2697913-Amphidinium_carterae.1